jgi:acyl-coenzyme A thioesterase PaaI-like protein|tara:strand:- start:51244 stop:51714 length:471 start_codon:yes stop_codon:yes gene_type:complete
VVRPHPFFDYREIPGGDGWYSWNPHDKTRFNAVVMGDLVTRREGDACRLRMVPEHKHTNLQGMLHGATILGLIDIALFAAVHVLGEGEPGPSLTLELSTQFVGAGDPEKPLDAVSEIVRETGRMVFVRGQVVQQDEVVASYSGIVRKRSSSGKAAG